MRLFIPGKGKTRFVIIAGVVLLLLGLNRLYTPAGARQNPLVETVSIPEITGLASEIVRGRVDGVVGTFNGQWNSDSSKDLEIVYTDYRMVITDGIKGQLKKGDTIVLRAVGKGKAPDSEFLDYNMPAFRTGSDYFLFLQKAPTKDQAYMSVEGSAGVFAVDGSDAVNQQDQQESSLLEFEEQIRQLVSN